MKLVGEEKQVAGDDVYEENQAVEDLVDEAINGRSQFRNAPIAKEKTCEIDESEIFGP